MALFYVASALLSYLLSMIMITISRKVTYQMRSDIFNKLSSLPVGYFDTHQAGDIISRISYDTDTINSSLSTDLVQVLASVITVGGSLGMMIAISPFPCPSASPGSSPPAPVPCSGCVLSRSASSTASPRKTSPV